MKRLILLIILIPLMVPSIAGAAPWITADRQDGAISQSNPSIALNYAQDHGANVIRVVTTGPDWIWNDGSWHGDWESVVNMLKAARQAGYQTYVSPDYGRDIGNETPQSVANYYRVILDRIGPYTNWISVGNEDDLNGITPFKYRQIWTAVASTVSKYWPNIHLVFGESPDIQWTKQAWTAQKQRPKHASAISIHAYDYGNVLWELPTLAKWAAKQHQPLFSSEMGPDTKAYVGQGESLQTYTKWTQWLTTHVPNLAMLSMYYWPSINDGW